MAGVAIQIHSKENVSILLAKADVHSFVYKASYPFFRNNEDQYNTQKIRNSEKKI